jgi:hypothetical protein
LVSAASLFETHAPDRGFQISHSFLKNLTDFHARDPAAVLKIVGAHFLTSPELNGYHGQFMGPRQASSVGKWVAFG